MKFKRILFVLQVMFVIAWMVIIFSFSNQKASSSLSVSERFLYKTVEVIKGKKLTAVDRARIKKKYIYIIRKCAHFFLYFVLGATIYIFLIMIMKSPVKPVILAILFSFLYAISDEIHQIYVPGRTSQMFDVMVDTCGAMMSIAFILLLRSFFNLLVCIFKKKK